MRKILITILLGLVVTSGFSQKKLRKTYGIEKVTETTIIFKDGNEIDRYISEYALYNDEGVWVEKVDLLPDGRIKKKEFRKFKKGEIVEEIVDEPTDRGTVDRNASFKHVKYNYDKGDLKKKEVLNAEGDLIEATTYVYNKFGDIVEERKLDGQGKELFTEKHIYDERGFKTEKQTYNASEMMVELKVYSYE